MLINTNELFRYYAAITLAKANVKVEKIVPILIEIYNDKRFKHLKHEIITFLRKFGSVAVSELIRLLTDSSSTKDQKEIRIMAVTILGDLGSDAQEAIPVLINVSEDPDVSIQATHALIKLGGEAVSSVIKIYEEKLTSVATPTS